MKYLVKTILIALLAMYVLLMSCSTEKKFVVRKVEHFKGRTYKVTTDSFVKYVRVKGMGRYQPKYISR